MCTLWCFRMCICVPVVCSGSPQSHVWGMCCLTVGLGEEEEPRDSRAQRRDSGRQTGGLPERLGLRTALGGGGPRA